MSTAEREQSRQSSVTTESDESALMERVASIVSRTMSDHYGDKLTFEVEVERHVRVGTTVTSPHIFTSRLYFAATNST